MSETQATPALEAFTRHRPRLFGLAYRMLGRVAEAEDVVQEVYVRWHTASGVREPEAWLVSAATRLCIDRLRHTTAERRTYLGPWLPEPVVSLDGRPDARLELASSLSMAFLLLLERLAPDERAAFLLREVFECDYRTLAAALDRSEAACRQLVKRARDRVRAGRPRFSATEAQRRRLVDQFTAAVVAQDEAALTAILSPGVTMTADGGGKAAAALNVVAGASKVARFFLGLERKFACEGRRLLPAHVNGEAGVVAVTGARRSTIAFDVDADGRISAIYVVTNPDKLTTVSVEES